MKTWTQDELHAIVEADDLHVAPFRADGETYGTPTWIWCVAVEDHLYVRAYNGTDSRWHEAAVRERAGKIEAAGEAREVVFEPAGDEALRERIDAAYRAKYEGSRYLSPMVSERARAATVRVLPRSTDA